MRTLAVVAVIVSGVVLGCAGLPKDKHRAYFHDEDKYNPAFSATHLGQDFGDSSVADLLSPEERRALGNAGWELPSRRAEAEADGLADAKSDFGREPSTGDKVAGATMTLLGLGITLGAMAAPYLLY